MPKVVDRRVVYRTPWFELVAKSLDEGPSPHYVVEPRDYVTAVATDTDGRVLLVRQFRPVVEGYTLEFPSGLVDPGETPEACIRRELLEETAHEPAAVELIGTLVPDTGRLGNRLSVFAATGLRPVRGATIEDGIELVTCTPAELLDHVRAGRCDHALNLGALMLAIAKNRFAGMAG